MCSARCCNRDFKDLLFMFYPFYVWFGCRKRLLYGGCLIGLLWHKQSLELFASCSERILNRTFRAFHLTGHFCFAHFQEVAHHNHGFLIRRQLVYSLLHASIGFPPVPAIFPAENWGR